MTWTALYAERAWSDAPAIVELARAVSYAELTARAGSAADALDALDAPPGRPIAGITATAVAGAPLMLAAAATHRPLAPLNVASTAAELRILFEQLEPSAIFADRRAVDTARAAGADLDVPVVEMPDWQPSSRVLDLTDTAADEPAAILHTSGTSGIPKAVPYRQDRLAARVVVNRRLLDLGPGSRYATASPFHYAAGIGNLFVALGCGAAMCPLPRFGAETWRQIAEVGATHATLVPTMVDRILDAGALPTGQLRLLQYGGSPARPETVRRLVAALPAVDLVQLYGQTEGTPLTALTGDDHRRAVADGAEHLLATAGRTIDEVELHLSQPDADGVGEIVARADHLMAPGPDGWLRTGDLGSLDADGYLTVIGRQGDMIIRGGENVYPDEIESVLATHPAVAEVAVVGQAHPSLGHVVSAHLVLVEGAARPTDDELRAFAGTELTRFKVPERWYWLTELPRNAAGKVLRRKL